MFKIKEEIEEWLENYGITNYTINDDLTVNVNEYVNLGNNSSLTEIPVQFNKVNGYFYCAHNSLTSLIGSPKEVLGNFHCNYNQLTSLVGSPKIVLGHFYCHSNRLTTLEGSPKEVNGNFYCAFNQLKSLKHLPKIHGNLLCKRDLHETKEYKIYEISKRLREMV